VNQNKHSLLHYTLPLSCHKSAALAFSRKQLQWHDRNDKLLEFLTRRSVAGFETLGNVLSKQLIYFLHLLVTDGVTDYQQHQRIGARPLDTEASCKTCRCCPLKNKQSWITQWQHQQSMEVVGRCHQVAMQVPRGLCDKAWFMPLCLRQWQIWNYTYSCSMHLGEIFKLFHLCFKKELTTMQTHPDIHIRHWVITIDIIIKYMRSTRAYILLH